MRCSRSSTQHQIISLQIRIDAYVIRNSDHKNIICTALLEYEKHQLICSDILAFANPQLEYLVYIEKQTQIRVPRCIHIHLLAYRLQGCPILNNALTCCG